MKLVIFFYEVFSLKCLSIFIGSYLNCFYFYLFFMMGNFFYVLISISLSNLVCPLLGLYALLLSLFYGTAIIRLNHLIMNLTINYLLLNFYVHFYVHFCVHFCASLWDFHLLIYVGIYCA